MNNDDNKFNEFKEEPLSEEDLDFEPIDEIPEEELEYGPVSEVTFQNSEDNLSRKELNNPKEEKQSRFKNNNLNVLSKNRFRANNVTNPRESFGSRIKNITSTDYETADSVKDLNNNNNTQVKETTSNKVKDKTKEGTAKVIKFAVSKIPFWVWIIIAGAAFLLLLIIIIFGILSDDDYGNRLKYDENCEVFSLKVTTLSKKEFVEIASNYLDNRYYKTESGRLAGMEFKNNLDTVYKKSVKAGINPELVLVRAVNEGFSPGISNNNYWGLGCFNGATNDQCMFFDSFSDGLDYFLQLVGNYDNTISMMYSFGFIGRYWFNPGNSSLGGCYYFTRGSVAQYMTPERKSQVAHYCRDPEIYPEAACSLDNMDNCVPTNDEDRRAKTLGSVMGMAYQRQAIFGLEPYDCPTYSECTIFKQSDSNWGDISLGNSAATMSSAGCAVTSIAIGISCANTKLSVNNFDPKVLINTLNKNGSCFTPSGGIYWGCSGIQEVAPSVKFEDKIDGVRSWSNSEKIAKIKEYDPKNHFILVNFSNNSTASHYVVVNEIIDNDTYNAKDPSPGVIAVHNLDEINQIIVYSFDPIED